MDLNNLGNLAQEASNLTNNPMVQQALNNPAVAGFVNEAEKFSGMDLNGNSSIGTAAPIQADNSTALAQDEATENLTEEASQTTEE
jgi:hypothetical protein